MIHHELCDLHFILLFVDIMKLLTSLILCFILLYTLALSGSAQNASYSSNKCGNGTLLQGTTDCLCNPGYTSSDYQGFCYDIINCMQCATRSTCDTRVPEKGYC
jgi:hypothetical protein